MNKQKFIEFIKNPGQLNEHNLEELDDLVTEYPYFQAGRVLEAKANRSLKTRIAGKKTASAAIYSTNRILFKKYLKEGAGVKVSPGSAGKTVTTNTPSPPSVEISTAKAPAAEVTQADTSEGSSSIDILIYNLQQDMKELEKSRARYIEVTRKIEEEEAVEKAVKRATGNVGAAASKSGSTTTRRTATRKPSSTTKKTTPARKSTSKSTATKKANTSKTTSKSSSTKPRATSSKKSAATKKTTSKSTASKSTAKKTTTKSTTRKSSARSPRATKSTKTTKSSQKDDTEGESQRQLIDQFIRSNPSFKPDGDTKNKEDLSLESTILPEDLVSEQLAEIFIEQGKKDKAIKIYNSLMLRFPEKKTYFAGRINEIE